MSKPTTQQRRVRRKRADRSRGNRWRVELHPSDRPLGPGLVMATPEEVMAALDSVPVEPTWSQIAARVMPLLERVRPYPRETPARAQAFVPPGLTVGFGVGIGPAFITITTEMIERWQMRPADVAAQALANLHRAAAQLVPANVIRGPLGRVEAAYLNAPNGLASALVLAPAEIRRLFGGQPLNLIAPMRVLLVGLPVNADPDLPEWLFAEVAADDPNHLQPQLFRFDGQQVSVQRLAKLT